MSERNRLVEEALEGLLNDGDSVLVTRRDDVVRANDHDPDKAGSPLATDDPELYGYLATLTSDLDGVTGCGYMVLWLAIGLGSGFAVDAYQPEFAEWRTYSAVLAVCMFLWNWTDDVLTMRVYRANRDELRDRLSRAGLSRERAIGLMGADDNVDTAAKYLKKDKNLSF